jgi:hypothetical protein
VEPKDWHKDFDPHQLGMIEHARTEMDFNHERSAHTSKAIVAKLADLLDDQERKLKKAKPEHPANGLGARYTPEP